MEIKILQVFYDKNGLPYKDKERTVHYPITSGTFLGASNTTQIRFYYDQLDELNESTFVAVSKLPNGKIGSEILESEYDGELQENYAVLNLSQFYTQYKGDVYISLQGYQGGVRVEQDENGIYQIYGTPTIQATGSIKLNIAYAPTFIGSGQTENITLQRVLSELATKLGIRQETLHVEELPTVGNPNVWYVVNDDPNDITKANIYIWNTTTQTYIWVGDNTLNLGDYYTKEQGDQFENDIDYRVTSVENELSSVAQGSPKGVFATLTDLQNLNPDHNYIYLVLADGHWYYWNGTAWTDGGVYQATEIGNGSVTKEKLNTSLTDIIAFKYPEKNLLDINSCVNGYYVNYGNGNLYSNADLKVTQFIELEPNTTYSLANLNMDQQQYNLGQMAFYDANKDYVSGETNSGLRRTTFNTGDTIRYVRVSLPIELTQVQLEKGSEPTTYQAYHLAIPNDNLSLQYQENIEKVPQLETQIENQRVKEVTVGPGGDYSTILEAILGTTPDVKIHVLNGIYNIVEEYKYVYGNDFWDNYENYFDQPQTYRGLYLENGREIYGDTNTVLMFNYEGENENVRLYFSVLAPTYDNYIHDLRIVIGNNSCRYAIHDDFASNKGTIKYERLVISGSPMANALIGAGCGQNNTYIIKDCIFLNNTKLHDISYHGNEGSSGSCLIYVSGCYGTKKCAFRWLGTSTQITYIVASNNRFGEISCEPYNNDAPIQNMEMFKFNNTEVQ